MGIPAIFNSTNPENPPVSQNENSSCGARARQVWEAVKNFFTITLPNFMMVEIPRFFRETVVPASGNVFEFVKAFFYMSEQEIHLYDMRGAVKTVKVGLSELRQRSQPTTTSLIQEIEALDLDSLSEELDALLKQGNTLYTAKNGTEREAIREDYHTKIVALKNSPQGMQLYALTAKLQEFLKPK